MPNHEAFQTQTKDRSFYLQAQTSDTHSPWDREHRLQSIRSGSLGWPYPEVDLASFSKPTACPPCHIRPAHFSSRTCVMAHRILETVPVPFSTKPSTDVSANTTPPTKRFSRPKMARANKKKLKAEHWKLDFSDFIKPW